MKKILPFLLFFICIHAYPQSIKKANKYLDAGEFQNAETEFNLVREKDSLNPELWLRYALLYSNEKFSPRDFFMAFEFIQKSSNLYYALDTKGKNKLSKSYSIDSVSQYKLVIDEKLFDFLKVTDDIALYEKYLTDCKKGVYVKQITELRNENAFKRAAKLNTLEAYKDFIANYPGASQISTAVTKRDQLAFKQTIEKNTIQAYDQFLNEYKYSTYVSTVIGLKNELLFLNLLDSPSKDSINAFITQMQQQKPKPQHLIDYSNKLLKILDAQNDWIIYLSDSNLYKMNQVDYKITQLTTSGDVLSFAISPKGDMAYLKKKDEKTVEIYKFNIDGVSSKICEFKTKYNNFSFENNFNTFEISDDIDYIRLGYGVDIEIEANQCLWSTKTNIWVECSINTIINGNCGIDFDLVKSNHKNTIGIGMYSSGDFIVKKVGKNYEIFKHTANGDYKITNTSSYVRQAFTGSADGFDYDTNGHKVFFSFITECGDFCYGPYFIVNLDGTNQRFLHHTGMNMTYHAWDYNGDLIVLSTEFENSDNINALCLFYGYENNKKVIAKNVDMFRAIKILNNDNLKLSKNEILQHLDFHTKYDLTFIVDELNGSTLGVSNGITYMKTPHGQGAVFSRMNESRIEYPFTKGLPHEGTIEMLIKVNKGYQYSNYSLQDNLKQAYIFSTGQSDVWNKGAMWLNVNNNGDINLTTALTSEPTSHTLSATATKFRFNEWHIVSFSYGSQGQFLMIDGQLVASDASYTETLQTCGDKFGNRVNPTVGEFRSLIWENNQHENGFEGILDVLRASSIQNDWVLHTETEILNLLDDKTALINNFKKNNVDLSNNISGNYVGTYKCGQGTTGLTLSISQNNNAPELDAEFNFYPVTSNLNVPSGSYLMKGTINGQKISLKGTEWIQQPDGYGMVDIECTWDKTNKTLKGIICNNEFKLTKQ